ncbi:MAG: hypothetical protein DKM24_00200 [Candidatus Melainabacteria bacterium]|nr:MAG: hypothetical protein DKM24_00200 [Candidatus Melainabacteria bacterium]
MKMRKNKAFTLAETLVVMGIIGVVAALTIPNLSSSTANKENVARVQKAYSTINEAFERVQAEYGNIQRWPLRDFGWNGNNDTDFFANRMSEYLKVSKNCARNANQGCMASSVKYLNGTSTTSGYSAVTDADTSAYKMILADGTGLAIQVVSGSIFMNVDIDGPRKGSGTIGKDWFRFVYDASSTKKVIPANTSNLTSSFATGEGLTAWVIETGNMDYLKAVNGTCKKNNKKLDWKNTTCN